MRDEMDLLGMDAAARLAWLRANRVTLVLVGLVWLGLIGERLASGEVPGFLIAMVPVFALVRFGAFLAYRRASRRSARADDRPE